MKPTQLTELLANIKATFVSFFSILMFVALGVGIFAGIYWMKPALTNVADATFDERLMHDIQIQFPYGLTESDIDKLSAVEGVEEVEGARQSYQQLSVDGRRHSVKVQSLTEATNVLQLVDGRLPSAANEMVMHEASARNLGITLGDTVAFEPDASGANGGTATADEDDATTPQRTMAYLLDQEYQVVGIANSPEYLALSSGTYGFAPTGSGAVDAVAWVGQEAFDPSAFRDGWPLVNVRCQGVEGLNSFEEEYRTAMRDVEARILALGDTLADERFTSLHDAAQAKIDEGEAKADEAQSQIETGEAQLAQGREELAAGEQQIAEGQAQLEEGERQIAEGQAQLDAGRNEYTEKTESARAQLDAALALLESARAEYDEASAKLQQAINLNDRLHELYAQAKEMVDAAENELDNIEALQSESFNRYRSGQMSPSEYYAAISRAYEDYRATYNSSKDSIAALNGNILEIQSVFPELDMGGTIPDLPDLPDLPAQNEAFNIDEVKASLDSRIAQARAALEEAKATSVIIEGISISFNTAGTVLPSIDQKIAEGQATLAEKKAELDEGEEQYNQAVAAYNAEAEEGARQLSEAEAQLEAAKEQEAQGRQELEEARQKAEEGKKELEEKSEQLEGGKAELTEKMAELDEAKSQLALMKDYSWTVSTRKYNGSAGQIETFGNVTNRLSYSMAALFVIVGLLVSYSAISRIVHEQVTQVGTKKALGLRSGEITASFLLYAALAVVAGALAGLVVGVVAVEGIIGNALAQRFTMQNIPGYYDAPLSLVAIGTELVLVLGAAWLACRRILKEHAVELLKGERPHAGKERFFERWKVWDKLPLYTQTIINNCINDKRRVFSTIVGVAGCTALVVTAITLNNDVLASYDLHYRDIYHFDTIAYIDRDEDPGDEDPADAAARALGNEGFAATAVLHQTNALNLPSGDKSSCTIVVPEDEEQFAQFYQMHPLAGGLADLDEECVWMTRAYAEHLGAKAGDKVTVNGSDGAVHTMTIGGFYNFYLTYHEMVIGRSAYEKLFSTPFKPNAVLVNRGDASLEDVEDVLSSVQGYDRAIDDKTGQRQNFDAFSSVSRTVVIVYLVLSVLMAIVVLLNLNFMFIGEKKRELIVLMINGFSTKDAKRYISQDTIVLTALGIVLGLVLGAVMGSLTVASIEPSTASFFKGIDPVALLVGAVTSAVLATIMSAIALRRIPAFDLTDINRF